MSRGELPISRHDDLIAHRGVEDRQQLSSGRGECKLGAFAGLTEALAVRPDRRVVTTGGRRRQRQRRSWRTLATRCINLLPFTSLNIQGSRWMDDADEAAFGRGMEAMERAALVGCLGRAGRMLGEAAQSRVRLGVQQPVARLLHALMRLTPPRSAPGRGT